MSNSYLEDATFACDHCGQRFDTKIWLILDTSEHPEVVQEALAGRLFISLCTHCHNEILMDVPILVYQPNQEPHLIYVPSKQMGEGGNRIWHHRLTKRIRKSLGKTWQKNWETQTTIVQRETLPFALRRSLDDQGVVLGAMLAGFSAKQLRSLLETYLRVEPEHKAVFLENNPDLLSPEVDLELQKLKVDARRQQEAGLLDSSFMFFFLEANAEILRKCRQAGVQKAFEELDQLSRDMPEEAFSLHEKALQLVRKEDMPRRVELLRKALVLIPSQTPPWGMIHQELANSLAMNPMGDRAENLEQAIQHRQIALQVFSLDHFAWDWAAAHNSLAADYGERFRGNREENIEQTIYHLKEALKVRTRDVLPYEWSKTQMNLGLAYEHRIKGGVRENMEAAIAYMEQALEVLVPQYYLEEWSMAQVNLGNMYSERLEGNPGENKERALSCYQEVAQAFRKDLYPDLWAAAESSLGKAYEFRLLGKREENLRQAVFHYRQALSVQNPHRFPKNALITASSLGNLGFFIKQWGIAREGYAIALEAHKTLYQALLGRSSKEGELAEIRGLPIQYAYVLVQSGKPREAVETLEAGLARMLSDSLEQKRRDLVQLEEMGFKELSDRYWRATSAYNDMLGQAGQRPPDWLEQIERTHWAINDVVSEIRARAGAKHPQFRHFLSSLSFKEIQKLAIDVPLIYLIVTAWGSLALVVSKKNVTDIKLDITETELVQLLQASGSRSEGGYVPGIMGDCPLKPELDVLLPILGEKISGKLAAELRKMRSKAVVIIPSGMLSIFPIHAAPYAVNGKQNSLLDEFTVTYVPSAMALEHARQALEGTGDERLSLLAVGDPFTEGIPDLPFARTEVEEIAKLFPRSLPLYERAATVQEVLKNFGGTTHLHFSCHGYFNPDSPLDSGILLSNNENMTLRNLLARSGLSGTRLTVLSACQTAITDFKRLPEEAIGLPAGFLQAGVLGVIGTLWPVNDFSTALLMIQFYRYHLNGDTDTGEGPMRPARALRKAQIWLRNVKNRDIKEYVKIALPEFQSRLTASQADGIYKALALENENVNPFEHPYFWAGFTFNGA